MNGEELRDIDALMERIRAEAERFNTPVNLFLFIDINPVRLGIPRRSYDVVRKWVIMARNADVDLEEMR